MAPEKDPFVELSEVSSTSSLRGKTYPTDHNTETSTSKTFNLPQEWVLTPQELGGDVKYQKMMTAYDLFLCAMPLVMMVKTGLCIFASGLDRFNIGVQIASVSRLTTFLVEFNGQLSTAFTIVFITIVSTMVRRWALFKAQQGASLLELEQLQASISLPSTVKMIWSLRSFGKLSLGLVSVWCFYYLGSQACKSEYALVNSKPLRTMPLAWPKWDNPSSLGTSLGNDTFSSHSLSEHLISQIYYTPMWTNRDSKPYDVSGNPLTPIIESISPMDPREWTNVPTSDISYSAFAGLDLYLHVPLTEIGLSSGSYYDNTQQYLGGLLFEASYTLVECGTVQMRQFEDFPNGTLPGTQTTINMTNNDRGLNAKGQPTHAREFQLWGRWSGGETAPVNGSFFSLCTLKQSFVDVQTHCEPSGCSAKKIRYTKPYSAPVPITPFDDDDFAKRFFDSLLTSTGAPVLDPTGITISPTTVDWMIGLYNSIISAINNGDSISADRDANMQGVALSLTALTNSYLTASKFDFEDCRTSQEGTYDEQHNPYCVHATGKGAIYKPQYLLSIPWIVIDFISCAILFLAALFGANLRKKTIAPDIFGYVSSLTRDNPHFDQLATDGSTLSGLERARLLGHMKIKIGDIEDEQQQVGRIGVCHVVDGNEVKRLQKDRKYA